MERPARRTARTATDTARGAGIEAAASPRGAPSASPLTIGELAARSGFTIKALRFYERRGLLPPSGRSAGGFRLYGEADLHRLEFIRQTKTLGLSLDQIRELVASARTQTCSMTRPRLLGVLDERIRQTARQIETLSRLKKELERRRRTLARRPPTDHARGYCACFEGSSGVALIPRILPKRADGRAPAPASDAARGPRAPGSA